MEKGWVRAALSGAALLLVAAAPVWTAEQNREDMMRRLGITRLIPGASGDPTSPRPANYDEGKATPYPDLPDPLTLKNGRKVADARTWREMRRPEILEDYAREVYGRVPEGLPPVQWSVVATDHERMAGFTPVLARRVIGHVPHPSDPARSVDIRMMVVLPEQAKGPVPVLILFGPDAFPNPSLPDQPTVDRINAALKALLVKQDPALEATFAEHQAMGFVAPPARPPERDRFGDLPRQDQLIAAGWGYVMLDTASIQADNGAGLRDGIIGLGNKGGPRTPDQWGALRAWGWGASRALDWLSTDPRIDGKRVGIEGVSRYGKAALVAMAFDERFAIGLIGSSGKGGTTLVRRNFGEQVGNLASGSFYWMAGNFMKYDTKGVSKPDFDASDLPVDANELIALAAPRPVFISYGVPEEGDAHWLDHKGSFLAAVDAGRVYKLLGRDGVGVTGPHTMPPVETMIDGTLAWRQHTGGHTDQPNFRHFIPWANRQLGIEASR
ncbi:hypothetical protein [Sphingomonas sp.]|uniref:glucuronyl esterase domain-containing protein n=1 Tax=Sphingomonas sp. TaxID=28214 RepID=UPI003B3B47F8